MALSCTPGQTCGVAVVIPAHRVGRRSATMSFTFTDGARLFKLSESLSGTGT